MKKTIAAILLALVAGQANADGFYQQVAGNSRQYSHVNGASTEFTYTPLYNQVVGQSREDLNQNQQAPRTASKTIYSPLYLKVRDSAG